MADTYIIGTNTSDLALDSSVLKATSLSMSELVDIATYKEMEFIDAVTQRTTPNLDVHMYFRKNKPGGAFGIGEQTHAPYTRYEVFEKNVTLKKYRSGVEVDDEARIRLDVANQVMNAVQMAGEAFAEYRDHEVLQTMLSGAGVTQSAGAHWHAAGADICGDLGDLLETLFAKEMCNVTEKEINSIVIYYPLKLYSSIREPAKLFDASTMTKPMATRIQTNTSDLDWARNTYGITWVGSKKLNYVGNAIAVIRSPRTLDHYTYVGNEVPQVETARNVYHGVNEWINTRYFSSFLYPNAANDINKNDRIMTITGVCDKTTMAS